FVEYMHTGTYARCGLIPEPQAVTCATEVLRPDNAELEARVLVLASRLVSKQLKEKALASLQLKLSWKRPARTIESICEIITIIYGGAHEPDGEMTEAEPIISPKMQAPDAASVGAFSPALGQVPSISTFSFEYPEKRKQSAKPAQSSATATSNSSRTV